MPLQITENEDGMGLMHHLFVNWDDSALARIMLKKLIQRHPSDCNSLTTYGETPLDLAIEHKTSVLKYVLDHHRD